MTTSRHSQNTSRGFALVLSILIIGVILSIGLAILSVTLKELILTSFARESVVALNAADAGMECALYWDTSSAGGVFDDGAGPTTITCMGTDTVVDGTAVSNITTHDLQYEWGTPTVCSLVTVRKYYSESGSLTMGSGRTCPLGTECSEIVASGYNRACDALDTDRAVERSLRVSY